MLSRDKRAKLEIKNKADDDDANGCFSLPSKSVLDLKLPSMEEPDAKIPLFLSRRKTEQNPRSNSWFWKIKNKDDDDDDDANGCFHLPSKSVLEHKLPSMDERDAKITLFVSRRKTKQNPSNNLDFWKIKKVLFKSDVNGNSRLMLGTSLVMNSILSTMTPAVAENCTTSEGQKFAVYDADDDTTHCLILKKHIGSSKSFVFIGKWCANFVNRRNLSIGDEVGLAWDGDNCRFLFEVLNRA